MKECPHCHEDSFGWRELVLLDYFSDSECKACGKQVRNDGVRQFLLVPTILVVIFLGVVVFSIAPDVLQPLSLVFLLVLIALSVVLLAKPVQAESPGAGFPSFTPDPNNDKVIITSGWKETELKRIVDDFREQDDVAPPMEIEIQPHHEAQFLLTFPADIAPWEFAALVNYLNYPFDFDLANRSLMIAGRTTLNSDFHGIPESLMGKKAIVYVPENDDDYTVVYLQAETGDTFAESMNEMGWQSVDAPRLPAAIRMLAFE